MFKMGGFIPFGIPRAVMMGEDDPPAGGGGKDKNKLVPQADVDKWYRIAKDNKEQIEELVKKLNKSEEEKVKIVAGVKALEEKLGKTVPTYVPQANDDRPLREVFNENNFPQSEEDWDDLISESPTYGSDLRQKFLNAKSTYDGKRKTALQTLWDKHPDMFQCDAEGKIIFYKVGPKGYVKDTEGNPIPDPSGRPIMNDDSEKAKLFNEIAGNDPRILDSVSAPVIIAEAMENRLSKKKEKDMKDKADKEKDEKEKNRKKKVDAAALATGGDQPPIEETDIKIEYTSDEEKAHVQKAISQGYFKDEKDYFKKKNSGVNIGYGRGGY